MHVRQSKILILNGSTSTESDVNTKHQQQQQTNNLNSVAFLNSQ